MVHLEISFPRALERAATRKVHLTDDEFELLHRRFAAPPAADFVVDVDGLDVAEQTRAIAELWMSA